MALFLLQAQMFVQPSHSDTNKGVNLLRQQNSFNLAPMEIDKYQIIQHSDYPTIPIITKVLTAILCYYS